MTALIVVCLAVSAAFFTGQLWGGGGSSQAAALDLVATQTVVAQTRAALSTTVSAATETAVIATLPPTPTAGPPTATPPPPTSTIDPNLPTPIPPGVPYVLITGITVQDDHYVVDYETMEFTASLNSQHIHFFFNTTPLEDAGAPGTGPYVMHAGPRPFSEVSVFDTPPEATQMCARVANVDHTILADSGNCVDLPIPEGGFPTATPPAVPPLKNRIKTPAGTTIDPTPASAAPGHPPIAARAAKVQPQKAFTAAAEFLPVIEDHSTALQACLVGILGQAGFPAIQPGHISGLWQTHFDARQVILYILVEIIPVALQV